MRIDIPEDVAIDLANILDEFTPKNKIDTALLLIRKRYVDNYQFWPDIAAQIRTAVEEEKDDKGYRLLDTRFGKDRPPDFTEIRMPQHVLDTLVLEDEVKEQEPENPIVYTVRRTRKKRIKAPDSDNK